MELPDQERRGVMLQRIASLLMVAFAVLWANETSAHGGGLDAYGCHRDKKAGTYHCHRGPLAGLTFADKEAMLKELARLGLQ